MKSVLFSLKHRHAKNILDGKKTSELRTRSPKQCTPYRAYLYDGLSDGGCGKIVGECVVYDDLERDLQKSIPESLSAVSCVSEMEILVYTYFGKKPLHELRVKDVVKYNKPKELSDFGLSRPPQSWCYVEELEEK